VQLPATLREVGCRLDSVLIPHGKRTSDVAIELALGERMLPIVSYAQLPPAIEAGVSPSTVSDSPDLRRALWAPEAPAGDNAVSSIADPELWPTGAVLRFDGGRTADGAASVVFEIERTPNEAVEDPPADLAGAAEPANPAVPAVPAPAPPASGTAPVGPWPPLGPVPTPVGPAPVPIGPSPAPGGPTTAPVGPSPAPGDRSPSTEPWSDVTVPASERQAEPRATPERQPGLLELIPYRHRVGVVAPDSFSIVLRAREKPFGIGVRSDRESPDPRLSYRAPGASESAQTHLVPMVVVVVSRCGRPINDILRDIK